jgi:hypothetical protein
LKFSKDNFNYFGNSELNDVWLPRMIFANSMDEDSLKFDDLSSVIVQRKGPRTLNSYSELQENELFDGENNPFVYNRTYDLNLSCIFKLENYPFDYQNCFIEVMLSNLTLRIKLRRWYYVKNGRKIKIFR